MIDPLLDFDPSQFRDHLAIRELNLNTDQTRTVPADLSFASFAFETLCIAFRIYILANKSFD